MISLVLTARSRKRLSLSPPPHDIPTWDVNVLYQRLLETAGINEVTDHIASIGTPRKSASELLIIDRALSSLLPSARGPMVTRLLTTIRELDTAEYRIRQASIKAQKLWRALDPSVSPISQLPDDLLILIFEHGARDEVDELLAQEGVETDIVKSIIGDGTLSDGSRPVTPFSLLVSHICENWRALALGRSSLWTTIRPFWNVDQIRAWLERSKTKSLHIDMVDSTDNLEPANRDLLRAHISRWASVSIHIRSLFVSDGSEESLMANYTDFLFNMGGRDGRVTTIPTLRHLSITSPVSVRLPIHSAGQCILPELETLRLQNAAADSLDEFFMNAIHAQVDLSGLFTWNWSGIGSAQRLRSLTLRSTFSAQDEENELEEPFSSWSLPTLQHLCVDVMPSGVCKSFLTLLYAPHLESFHVNLRGKDRRAKQTILNFVSFCWSTLFVLN